MTAPEPHTLPAELQARKDAAEVAKAEAEARSATVKADQDAADARRQPFTAVAENLSKVKESTLEVKDGPALMGTALTYRALTKAARDIVAGLPEHPQPWRVLITSKADLASADAGYGDVNTGLDQLLTAAGALLPATGEADRSFAAGLVTEAAAILASALPPVMDLVTAHRTVSTAAATVDDLAAAAAVAGALPGAEKGAVTVVHDDFRLVPGGGVYEKITKVSTKRQELVASKIVLDDRKSTASADLATAQAELKELEKTSPGDAAGIETARKNVREQSVAVQHATVRIGLIDSVIAAVDAFNTAIRTVPPNASRSALASAALHEQLHSDANRFTHVLLVKTEAGQTQQVTQNRPLWFKDRFTTFVDVNVMYMLIETTGSTLISSGTVTATATATGRIGGDFTPEVR
jgi:hypothetical protein